MKKIILTAAAILTAWSITASANGIGVVDMKMIFTKSPDVKSIKEKLNTQFTPEKNKLEKMGQALQADIAQYQKNKAVMKPADLAKLQSSITAQETQFRTEQAKFQQEVFAAQNKSLADFMASVKAAVKTVAEKDNLDLVIPNNDVLYSKDNKDITKEVLENLK